MGSVQENAAFAEVLSAHDPAVGSWFEVGWESVQEGFMPLELLLDQLPERLNLGEQNLRLQYKPILLDGEVPVRTMVIISDITDQVERERVEQVSREMMELFQRILADRVGFLEFYAEADEIVSNVCAGGNSMIVEKRDIHTLKGNAGIYGITTLVDLCHQLETELGESGELSSDEQRERLSVAWVEFKARLELLLGEQGGDSIEIDDKDYEDILRAVVSGVPHSEIAHRIRMWKLEPTSRRLERIAEQSRGIARRLNKEHIAIDLQASPLRLNSTHWAPFWSTFIHAVRNAVDHGIESTEEREAAGKSAEAHLTVAVEMDGEEFVVRLGDDGRGIDWEEVGSRALSMGLASETQENLMEALCTDGLTTRSEASVVSGRGVGMSALRDTCENMGGQFTVESQLGKGTVLEFRFPHGSDVEMEQQLAA